MTAAEWLQASLWALLDENAAVDPLRVFGFVPDRAVFPYAEIEAPVLRDASGAGVSGRVGSIAMTFHDGGEQPDRLRFLMGRVEDEVNRFPDEPASDGWRLAGLALAESRTARVKGAWRGRLVWGVRVFRIN